ncbi:STAS domain-containing protein [Solihabitans fulvus]|uniref:Anti-sigma factor antagonist n=1 Tax=Solihabitans fulvus TaxID=1892852 RepID=A0A5B2X4F1_9PSEU|nr:STAS domain-containing protein [Solihabitans fulvus]KAA2258126.1 STAS domain-containing protein [Solihabitans fulvus]
MSQHSPELIRVSLAWPDPATVVVAVAGEVDMNTIDQVRTGLSEATGSPAATLAVVDLTKVTFLGSVGLSALVEASEAGEQTGCRLIIVADQHAVLRPLEATGLAEHFVIHASVADAVTAGTGSI